MKKQKFFSTEIVDNFWEYDAIMPHIIEEAETIKKNSKDFIINNVPMASFTVGPECELSFCNVIDGEMTFKTTQRAMTQFCTKLDIPYKNFFMKLRHSTNHRKEKIQLTKSVFEELTNYYPKPVMVRTYKDIIRAVLSSKYSIYDSDKITRDIDTCIKEKMNTADVAIKGYINTPEQFQVRIIDKREIPVEKDKSIYCGLTISSSDIGASKLNVEFYLYQSMDSNGICINVMKQTETKMFTQKHMGIEEEAIKEKIENALEKFPNAQENILEYVLYATHKSLKQSGIYNPKSFNGRHIFKELGLTQDENIKKFLEILEKHPKTLWGYVNSITEYASQIKNYEERITLERLAGKILIHPENYGIRKEE